MIYEQKKPGNHQIGLLRESSLHASLKKSLAMDTDHIEVPVDGYLIDIVRDYQLIEIQTGNFSSIREKLSKLVIDHPVRLVYPLAREKWIIKETSGERKSRRKSPRQGRLEDIFYELVRVTSLISHPNFSLEVILTSEEEIQVPSGETNQRGSWRRKGWVIIDRRLVTIEDQIFFNNVLDYGIFLNNFGVNELFTSRDFCQSLNIPINLAQKMLYCLLRIGLLEEIGKRKRARLYKKNFT